VPHLQPSPIALVSGALVWSPAIRAEWAAIEAEYQALKGAAGEYVDTDDWG